MIIQFLLLLLFSTAQAFTDNDVCVVLIQDGHSNEQDSITADHCELYDRLKHNNASTLQTINMDGTIAGCWLYETDTEEVFYYNENLNPSGMCSAPHHCVQYADCTANVSGSETLYIAPTSSPTSPAPTTDDDGIDVASNDMSDSPTNTPTRSPPSFPTNNIIAIATVTLVSLAAVMGFLATKTQHKRNVTYP
jgi:hypothetical protein